MATPAASARSRRAPIVLPPSSSQESEPDNHPAPAPERVLPQADQQIVTLWSLTPTKKRKFVEAMDIYDGLASGGPSAEVSGGAGRNFEGGRMEVKLTISIKLEPDERQGRFCFLSNTAAHLTTLSALALAAPTRNIAAPPQAPTALTTIQTTYVKSLTNSLYLLQYAAPNAVNVGRVLAYCKLHKDVLGGGDTFFMKGSPAYSSLEKVVKNQLDQRRHDVTKLVHSSCLSIACAAWGAEAMGGPASLNLVDGKVASLHELALEWVKPLGGDARSHFSAPLIARLACLRGLAVQYAASLKDENAQADDELYQVTHGRFRYSVSVGAKGTKWVQDGDFLPFVDSAIQGANEEHDTPKKLSKYALFLSLLLFSARIVSWICHQRYLMGVVKRDIRSSAPEPSLTLHLAAALPEVTTGERTGAEMMR
ncbi:hypothetical protein P7C70_g7960, partial [Phenoliferia sp. Uapishka_3]